jgi:hypothetical protein
MLLEEFGIPGGVANLLLEKIAPTGKLYGDAELPWVQNKEGLWETTSQQHFKYRIYPGIYSPDRGDSFDTLDFGIKIGGKFDFNTLKGDGFTALHLSAGGPNYYHGPSATTIEEVKAAINCEWQSHLMEMKELEILHREPLNVDGVLAGANDVPVISAEEVAPGFFLLQAENGNDYFRVTQSWLELLPEVFRPFDFNKDTDLEDGSGMDYLCYDVGAIFPLCFPQIFTTAEVEYSIGCLQRFYPNAYHYIALDGKVTAAEKTKASRGFSSQLDSYSLIEIINEKADGEAIILARLTSSFGHNGTSEEELLRRADELHIFRVPQGANLESTFQFDDYEYKGLYDMKYQDYIYQQSSNRNMFR